MSDKMYAVLTGDIVKSRDLSADQSKALQNRLKSAAQEFESVFPGTLVGKLGITQGDGWQVALAKHANALRLALFLRAVVKAEFGADSRVSIGIGTVERLEADVLESEGVAFERSGHGLESLKNKKNRMIYQTPKASSRLESAESCLVAWVDFMVTPASAAQARSLYHSLLDMKQEKVAEITGVVQSTVSEGLAAIGWNEIKATLQYFENIGQLADKI